MTFTPVRRALLSVSDKTGLVDFARTLHQQGVELLSTGGTAKLLRGESLPVTDVSTLTGFPEILDGRVKTLHPGVHGGLLARRDDPGHLAAVAEHNLALIDLAVINLYPFAATLARGAGWDECVENIDIGGPAMIRAAAKNYHGVAVVTDPAQYATVLEEMAAHGGQVSLAVRQGLAAAAFAHTAGYDGLVAQAFAKQNGEPFPAQLVITAMRQDILRYGENPHQQAAVYRTGNRPGVLNARQVQGKALSYNNLNDADAAFAAVSSFTETPAVAIIKHANPCGLAVGVNLAEAYKKALACDPVSAFGGIVAVNRELDAATASQIAELFAEVVIAPTLAAEAGTILTAKKNLRVLVTGGLAAPGGQELRNLGDGFLVQDTDGITVTAEQLAVVTERHPTDAETQDLLFAFRACKYVKSNAIVLARNGATLGIGAGQMSRVDAVRIAVQKAHDAGFNLDGAVIASDAFFPFADGLEIALKAGIRAAIQPGGSKRDPEVIAAANAAGAAMVFTGVRHFRH